MFRWFNPHPPTGDADGLLKATPYPGDYAESVLAAEDAQLVQMERPKAHAVPGDGGMCAARPWEACGKTGTASPPACIKSLSLVVQQHPPRQPRRAFLQPPRQALA